jgi:hypothetical protein
VATWRPCCSESRVLDWASRRASGGDLLAAPLAVLALMGIPSSIAESKTRRTAGQVRPSAIARTWPFPGERETAAFSSRRPRLCGASLCAYVASRGARATA